MRSLAVLWCVAASGALHAQQPPAPPPAESARADSTGLPGLPTPEQHKFLEGLRTAGRGVAQLKDGVSRVTRAPGGDVAAQRRAGRFLGGLCGSARGFMRRGRPAMSPIAYADTARLMARRLVAQIDSLIAYAPACEDSAAALPAAIATELGKRIKRYDAAFRDFRQAIGLPVRGP